MSIHTFRDAFIIYIYLMSFFAITHIHIFTLLDRQINIKMEILIFPINDDVYCFRKMKYAYYNKRCKYI